MNKRLIFLGGVVMTAIASAAWLDPITLRHALSPDSTETYKMVTDVKQTVAVPGQGDVDILMNTSMDVAMKTGKADDKGSFDIETTMSNIKTTMDGPMAEMMQQQQDKAPKTIKTTGKINDRNQMTMNPDKSAKADPMTQLMGGTSAGASVMFVEFPEKPVSVGDTWTFNLPKTPMYGKEAPVVNAKLVGEKDFNGTKVWIVSTDGKIKLNVDLGEMMKDQPGNPMAGQSMIMTGNIDMTGEALIDQANGKTLSYITKMKSKANMDMGGMSIDTTGTVTNTLTAAK